MPSPPREAIVQQAAGRSPWGHVMVLLDTLDDHEGPDVYAAAAAEHGWSRQVLVHHVATRLRARSASAPSSFSAVLPAGDPELAQALTRDPYVLDVLEASAPLAERELEDALLARFQDFLPELGHGHPGDPSGSRPAHVGQHGARHRDQVGR